MTSVDRALEFFSKRFNCAQSVLAAHGPAEGLAEADCLRIAAPFGGGIGRLGETCGAVVGAIMVLGLRHGADVGGDPDKKLAHNEMVRGFVARFKARHGNTRCRDLLGCDLSTPEGFREAMERKLFSTRCPEFVRTAATLLEEMRRPE